jgi:hypothetical protein
MPPAVALAIPAIAGVGAQAAGGKKGNNAAQTAANNQFQMQQQLFNTGLSDFTPASNYYKSLLSGDPTQIAAAVGPTSDILKGQQQSQAQQIAATSPAGGEANAAQAANSQNSYNSLARLYAGVQPGAAAALGQLSATPLGLSAPNAGSGLKFDTHQQEQQNQTKGGLGTGLGTLAVGAQRGKQGGSGKSSGGKGGSGGVTSGGDNGNFPGAIIN